MMPNDPKENKDRWNNWNYICYIRLDHPDSAPEIEKLIEVIFRKHNPEYTSEENDSLSSSVVHLSPLTDVHFSTIANKSASSRTTVYLLICISFLIVIIATINFMNFSLAETPMRIKSINTQKRIGSNNPFTSLQSDSRIRTHQHHCLYAFSDRGTTIERFRSEGPGKRRTTAFGTSYTAHHYFLPEPAHGILSWHISLLLCYIVCTSTGTKRLFWSFS